MPAAWQVCAFILPFISPLKNDRTMKGENDSQAVIK